jgi:flavodoxin
MNENDFYDTELSTETGISVDEFVENDSISGSDSVESVSDSDADNGDYASSSGSISHFDEELGAYPVYIVESTEESETLSEDDIMLAATYTDYYSYLPTQMYEYISGILANMKDTDYVAFAYRHYNSDSYNSYIDYYRLVYDVQVDNDVLVPGSYPCIEISKDSNYSSSYVQVETTYELTSVPDFSYGSFGHLSDLRKGVSHDETYAFLFFAGFCVCSFVLHNLFSFFHKSR